VETIEAAVTVPVVFLLMMSMINFGWAVYAQQMVQEAARHGARMGSTAQGNAAGTALSYASSYARGAGLRNSSVSVLAPGGVAGSVLRIRVSYNVPSLLAWAGVQFGEAVGEAEFRQEGW